MESIADNSLNSLFWPISFIITVSALFEVFIFYFLLSIGLFTASFYLFFTMGFILYSLSYLLVFRHLISGTGKPEIPAVILIIFCFFIFTFSMLGLAIIAGIILGGRRDKRVYYRNNIKPANYSEISQISTEGWSKIFRSYRLRKNTLLIFSSILLILYSLVILSILGIFTTNIYEFYHFFTGGLNSNLLTPILTFMGIPLALVPLLNPVSRVYKYLPGRTGVITRLKGNSGLCIVKVEGLKFRARYPLGLGIGSEVLVRKVLIKGSTRVPILDIESYYQDSRSNLASSTT